MSIRKLGFMLAAVCAALMVVPVVAGAQTTSPGPQTPPTGIPTTSLASVPVSGIAKNHKKFTGHFTVDRFVARNGKTFAIGRLVGNVGHRHIDRSNVAIPASVAKNPAVGALVVAEVEADGEGGGWHQREQDRRAPGVARPVVVSGSAPRRVRRLRVRT